MELADRLGREVFDIPVDELTEGQKYDLIYTKEFFCRTRMWYSAFQPFKGAGYHSASTYTGLEELLERHSRGSSVINLADSIALADRLLRVRKGKRGQAV